MNMKEFQKEKEKLHEIIQKYDEIMEYLDLRIEAIPRLYMNNPTMIESLLKMHSEKLNLMKKSIKKPYFARLDFERDGESKVEQLYIGKVGVMDEDNNNITIDWRAPISSIYYDSNIGRVSYEAPEGTCTGELLVKRQYDIEDGELNSYQDVDTVSNDELLKPYLGANADNRLKNIVSTIQTEQNSIIRESLSKNVIVQGVAGSGKTTVALHRIAYLVYNNRDKIRPEQYLVIGPNKFFVNYISGVLPDLDVNNVAQLTYEELCAYFINEDIRLINEEKNLIASISNQEDLKYEKFKVSMKYKEALDAFINELDKNIIPDSDLEIRGYEIISNNLIKKNYNSINDNNVYNTILKKIEKTKLLLGKYIEDNSDTIMANIKTKYYDNIEGLSEKIKEKELAKVNFIEKEINNKCNASLKKYFSSVIPNILDLYYKFLMNIKKYIEINENIDCKLQENALNIKKKKVEFEDLSALIYLKCRIIGLEEYTNYRQVAIDEAQDFGEFSFYVLKELFKNATFSIFGDLAQSIYQYRSISNWQEVIDTTFNNACEIKYLLKSYRTTTEIMNAANNITKYIKLNPAQPVIRHGADVTYITYKDNTSQIDIILKTIQEYKEKGYISIAVICKDEKEASLMNLELVNRKINVKNIIDSDTQYDGGICIITSYLAKGLEFDGVIISNASEEIYNSDRVIDMKLLYVAMTRPLHELKVLYKDNITKPLYSQVFAE